MRKNAILVMHPFRPSYCSPNKNAGPRRRKHARGDSEREERSRRGERELGGGRERRGRRKRKVEGWEEGDKWGDTRTEARGGKKIFPIYVYLHSVFP